MTSEFVVGERVRALRPATPDYSDTVGIVESFHDWWIMVRMDQSGVLFPFMASELTHERTNDIRKSA